MVDIMTTTSDSYGKPNNSEDYEDGELPEDGEIQDDEEVTAPSSHHSPPAQASPKPNNTSPIPPIKKFAPRGFGDDIEAPATNRDSVWVPKESEGYGYGGEDRDYRFEDDGYGDSDYRQGGPGRRRRHSPPGDDFDGRGRRPWRPFKKPKWATEHQICKFFREGYCRDGEQCTYSHQAEDSLRKAELCRFYANGFCKKGLTCLALHGEFPCIAFHKGECNAEHCRFSHLPLTDYTRPLYENKIKDEEMGFGHRGGPHHHYPPQGGPPGMPPGRRRVLIPGGPGPSHEPHGAPPPHHQNMPPAIHAPLPPTSNGHLPPPSVVVPTIAGNHGLPPHMPPYPQMPPRGGFFPPAPMAQASPLRDDGMPPPQVQGPPHSHQQGPPVVPPGPAQPFDISQMLARIAGSAAPVEESPASPPQMFGMEPSVSSEHVRAIPDAQEVVWRILPVEAPRPYHGVEPREMSNDPRMNRVIASQFDAVSNMFANDGAGLPHAAPLVDPRVRDPRRRPDDRKTNEDKSRSSSWMPQIA